MSGTPHSTNGSPDATAEPPQTADARTGPRTGVRLAVGAVALLATGALIALVAVRADGPVFTGIEQIPLPGGADLGTVRTRSPPSSVTSSAWPRSRR